MSVAGGAPGDSERLRNSGGISQSIEATAREPGGPPPGVSVRPPAWATPAKTSTASAPAGTTRRAPAVLPSTAAPLLTVPSVDRLPGMRMGAPSCSWTGTRSPRSERAEGTPRQGHPVVAGCLATRPQGTLRIGPAVVAARVIRPRLRLGLTMPCLWVGSPIGSPPKRRGTRRGREPHGPRPPGQIWCRYRISRGAR